MGRGYDSLVLRLLKYICSIWQCYSLFLLKSNCSENFKTAISKNVNSLCYIKYYYLKSN